ncbi:MAG: hypothetical protein AB2L14_13110 [Candidatus Xenobiia bacterium LiM19]
MVGSQAANETGSMFLLSERNRKNAQHSTGPRTQKGKKKVSRNALKHGLLAREVIVAGAGFGENKQEFKRLCLQLEKNLQPVGKMEDILVEKIAISYWRLTRVLRVESGEIKKQLLQLAEDNQAGGMYASEKKQTDIQHIKTLIEEANIAIEILKMNDGLTQQGLEYLKKKFGPEQEQIVFWCNLLLKQLSQNETGKNEDYSQTVEELCLELIKTITDLTTKLQIKLLYVQAYYLERKEAELQSRALPPMDALERICKYETAIERQLYRAVHELERLQRLRMGEAIVPPLPVDI